MAIEMLRSRYEQAMNHLSTQERESYWQQLHANYSSEARHYHNWSHIAEFIESLEKIDFADVNPSAYIQAAFYHDAIYLPGAKDNEEASLELWFKHYGPVDAATATLVSSLILSTKHHVPFSVPFSAEFIDCDLSPLAYAADRYTQYVRQIRQEYSAFNDATWTFGRTKFLQHCLQQNGGRIFWSSISSDEDQRTARENISSELESLQSK